MKTTRAPAPENVARQATVVCRAAIPTPPAGDRPAALAFPVYVMQSDRPADSEQHSGVEDDKALASARRPVDHTPKKKRLALAHLKPTASRASARRWVQPEAADASIINLLQRQPRRDPRKPPKDRT